MGATMGNAVDTAPLLIDEQGPVAWLTMNRPERLNAMDPTLVDALRHYFEALRDRLDIRVVVLRGTQIESVPLAEVAGRSRNVPLDHPLLQTLRDTGISSGTVAK